MMPRVEPVEDRRACAANVQVAGRRRGEADANSHGGAECYTSDQLYYTCMTISVRLDEKTKRRLSRYAREQRVSQSEVVRRAINAYMNSDDTMDGVSLYDRMKDIIGSVRGGPTDLSENTGEKFRQILLEKKRQGRL